MTSDHQTPVQYNKLFDLLSQYSQKYYNETEAVFMKFGRQWNPYISKFEIDVYFLSMLTFSIVGFKQDRDVGVELQLYFAERFIQGSGGKISTATAFEDIISSRVNSYCQLKHDCIKDSKNRNIEMEMLQEILWNIDYSNSNEEIKACSPLVIRDFFDQMELKSSMFPMHIKESIEFRSCLKELFEATSDIRSLSSEEMDTLIDNGRKEAEEILSRLDLQQIADSINITKHIRTILAERKKWWQFWK